MYLKKALIVSCLVVITLYAPLKAEIINFELGMSSLPNSIVLVSYHRELQVKTNALLFGFSIPIHVPYLDVHFRVEKAYHSTENVRMTNNEITYMPLNTDYTYTYNTNELLVGKQFSIYNVITGLPQIGLGYSYEMIERDSNGTGLAERFWFMSASFLAQKAISEFKVGFRIHAEYSIQNVEYSNKDFTLKIKTGLVFSL